MKNVVTAMFLLILCMIMVSGVTLAFFTDQPDEIDIYFTAGRLETEIEGIQVEGGWDNWLPDEENAKEVLWLFKNTGSKKAYLRARIDKVWRFKKPEQECRKEKMYAAVHVSIEKCMAACETTTEPGEINTIWTQVSITPWVEGNDGYWYCCEAVNPGDTVILGFEVSYITLEGYMDAEYEINLSVEAIQASNNAVSKWNGPCLSD